MQPTAMWAAAQRNETTSNRFAVRAIPAISRYASESRKPSAPPSGPAAAAVEVSTATAAIASAAHTGWLPVAKPTTVRSRVHPAAATARRREIPDGPIEPQAATIAPASAASSVPLICGNAAPRATPATRPATR
jgi:hypothetical protein